MPVLLKISENYSIVPGDVTSAPPIADTMASPTPGPLGCDLGAVVNGSYAPKLDQAANTGHQKLYISHDADTDPITNVKFFIQPYGVGTSFPYGGAQTALIDFNNVVGLGVDSALGDPKNQTGNVGGFWFYQNANAIVANHFNTATDPLNTFIFGKNGGGIDLATAYPLLDTALVCGVNSGAGVDGDGNYMPTAPQLQVIGKPMDTVLGDAAKIRARIYLPTDYLFGSYHQFELVVSYTYTA